MTSRSGVDAGGERDRVRIPADVDRPDRILIGLTARQVIILAGCALLLYAGYAATCTLLPPPVFAIIAFPVATAAGAFALASFDGLPLDRLAAAALTYARTPRQQVPVDGPIPAAPSWTGWPAASVPAPLALPGRDLNDDGVIDLGGLGAALVCQCSSLNFALRTPGEQQALIGAFGQFLNSLSVPVQVVVRSDRVDLTATIAALATAAGGLPHPGLEAAARSHAAFLRDLTVQRDLLARQLLLVLREPPPLPTRPGSRLSARLGGRPAVSQAADTGQLHRRAEHARSALAAAGVHVDILDGPTATNVLWSATNPGTPPRPPGLSAGNTIITGPTEPGWPEGLSWLDD